MNNKTCPYCKQRYEPIRSFQKHCLETECILEGNEKVRELQKKVNRKALKKFNDSDMSKLKRKAQFIFNKYIRLRDKDLPCVSCGLECDFNKSHASHYKPATNSRLRFDERNVHKSCVKCNVFLSGNLSEYKTRLINKLGAEVVEELDNTKSPYTFSIDELQDIITTYKNKVKELL